MDNRTLYDILGIDRTASQDDIKKAYRKKSSIYHPDIPGTGDVDEFRSVNNAYNILTDLEKKKIYDRSGIVAKRSREEEAMLLIQEVTSSIMGGTKTDSFTGTNFLDRCTQKILESIDNIKVNIENYRKRLQIVRNEKAKINCSKGRNIFDLCLDGEAENCKSQIASLRFHQDVHEKSLEILQNYKVT